MKKLLALFSIIGALLISSCMMSVRLNLMKPAEVMIPQHIQKIGVVDRTKPGDERINVLEGALTGEMIGQDKEGVENAVNGLVNLLANSPRFEIIRTNVRLEGNAASNSFPPPLSWTAVENYTLRANVDALLIIEVYDSDFIITDGSKEVTKKNKDGKEYKTNEYFAEGVANLKVGFRLYDPETKSIIDQEMFRQDRTWKATAASKKEALAKLINRQNALNDLSYVIGEIYGRRIAPSWVTASRSYYKKDSNSPNIEVGTRKAEVNDWDGAIEEWKKAMDRGDFDSKGKAAYNIALGYEVLGYLDDAKDWAQKAYTEFGNKKARDYVRIIEHRIWEEQRLREQLGE